MKLTLVLCSAADLDAALREIRLEEFLAPAGLVAPHIAGVAVEAGAA